MKKDKEWAIIELSKLTPSHAETHDSPDDITVMKCELLNKAYDILSQLDEPEVLSQEWVKDKQLMKIGPEGVVYYVPSDDLQNILVPEQEDLFNGEEPDEGEVYFAVGLEGAVEVSSASNIDEAIEILAEYETNHNILKKPVIPKFVAEHIENRRGESLAQAYNVSTVTKVGKWLLDKENCETFAKAWLGGYAIKKEQKYYARIKGWENVTTGSEAFNWVYFKEKDTVGISKAVENKYQSVSFTKYDWNNLGINEHNADFVLVQELEE